MRTGHARERRQRRRRPVPRRFRHEAVRLLRAYLVPKRWPRL